MCWRPENSAVGSSPRSRGTRPRRLGRGRSCRFIPALAGNTPMPKARPDEEPVHPRARGEHAGTSSWRPTTIGSSPRSRGTRRSAHSLDNVCRFIPALAGNTCCLSSDPTSRTVHPRARGEHDLPNAALSSHDGSSPRSRGTPRFFQFAHCDFRFIPALAGNTTPTNCAGYSASVHPRARGEHVTVCSRTCDNLRFIPALAGNTAQDDRDLPLVPVHPRARGEHIKGVIPRDAYCGSSPRSRGTQSSKTSCAFSISVHPRARGEHRRK